MQSPTRCCLQGEYLNYLTLSHTGLWAVQTSLIMLVLCTTVQTSVLALWTPNALKESGKNTMHFIAVSTGKVQNILARRVFIIESYRRNSCLVFILRTILCLLSNVLVFNFKNTTLRMLGNKLYLNWKQVLMS